MTTIKTVFSIVFLIFLFNACNKEGKGGTASIEGKIMIELISKANQQVAATYEAKDEKVYIIYGDNNTFDDDTKTTYNGKFKFDYLYKGVYQIYTYSECLFHIEDCPSKSNTMIDTITINTNKEIITIPTVTIKKYI